MESKIIRFEKGQLYYDFELGIIGFYAESKTIQNFKRRPDKQRGPQSFFECLKSFTVQINIIEDEQ